MSQIERIAGVLEPLFEDLDRSGTAALGFLPNVSTQLAMAGLKHQYGDDAVETFPARGSLEYIAMTEEEANYQLRRMSTIQHNLGSSALVVVSGAELFANMRAGGHPMLAKELHDLRDRRSEKSPKLLITGDVNRGMILTGILTRHGEPNFSDLMGSHHILPSTEGPLESYKVVNHAPHKPYVSQVETQTQTDFKPVIFGGPKLGEPGSGQEYAVLYGQRRGAKTT